MCLCPLSVPGNKLQLTPKELNDNKFGSFILVTKGPVPQSTGPDKSPAASLRSSLFTTLACLVGLAALRRATL